MPNLIAPLLVVLVLSCGHKVHHYRLYDCCCCVSVRMAGALRHLGQLPVSCRYSVRQLDLHLLLQEVS